MKILSLKALNINSLKGKTEINFEALTKDGALFSITGPTGSGKSTILDIISCALYGRTARLKNPNDLMSRHTGEAYCEVEFEIKGKLYRSSWSQKRARNRHDGKFQTAKMELFDIAKEEILSQKSREVPKKVEELSGLDFARFAQSMMLAQGSFDAFLRADEKERSALLEKITGTQIYAKISIAVFEKHRNLANDIVSDEKVLSSIELLSDENEKQKQKELDEKIILKKKSDDELKKLAVLLEWLKTVSQLKEENEKYEKEFIEATKLKQEHKSSFIRLDLANKALNVSSIFSRYEQLRRSTSSNKASMLKLTKELKSLNEQLKQKDDAYRQAKEVFEKESKIFEQKSKKLKKARETQLQEKQKQEEIYKTKVSIKAKQEELNKQKEVFDIINKQHKQIGTEIEIKEKYLSSNIIDKKLLSVIGTIEQNISFYKEEEKRLKKNQEALKLFDETIKSEKLKQDSLQKEVLKLSIVFKEKKSSYEKIDMKSSSADKLEETLLQSLQETETLLQTLKSHKEFCAKIKSESKEIENYKIQEKSLLQTQSVLKQHIFKTKEHLELLRDKKEKEMLLKSFEQQRKKLIDSKPCPLCGSTTHPFSEGLGDISIDETEIKITTQIDELESKESELGELKKRLVMIQTRAKSSQMELEKLDKASKVLQDIFMKFSFEITHESEAILTDKIEKITAQQKQIKKERLEKDRLTKERENAREILQTQEYLLSSATLSLEKQISEQKQLLSSIMSSQAKIEALHKTLSQSFEELHVELKLKQIDEEYKKLQTRKELYAQNQEDLGILNREFNSCNIERKEYETKVSAIKVELQTAVRYMEELEQKVKELTLQRIGILNVADLDSYEKELLNPYQKAQEQEQSLQMELSELKIKSNERISHKCELESKMKEEAKNLDEIVLTLEKLYKKNGFQSELEFKNANISHEEREELAGECKRVQEIYTGAQTLKTQTEQKLQELQKEPLTNKQKEELEVVQSLLQQKADALLEMMGSYKKELELNDENRAKFQKRISTLEKKKEELKVWVKLNELVGSADGTKFKKFAQGITLDQLIYLANQHLKILSTRYILARNQDKLLDLEVIDAYQGNVTRPVNTLSGGESFIVSLALALGLSELASQKIAIDSLFLDEGFGTLDDENLEIALNALNLLQSSGKMVGVISHVEALKERIPLQIKVVPNGDGSSFVEI